MPKEIVKTGVADCFEDKTIFLTGATGFVGKVLIEKLIRSCNPRKIYVLVRAKNDKVQNRMTEIFNGPLFEPVKSQRGTEIFTEKIEVIDGSVSLKALGISQEDRKKLANEVEMVFHCAANIRFDLPLKEIVITNVLGTKMMLELAKEMKNLECFAYLSTAFSQIHNPVVEEKLYDPPMDPELIIQMVKNIGDEDMEYISKRLLKGFPNSYIYSKALSENVIAKEFDNLPIILQRPSLIMAIWKEPIPGWFANMNGPVGIVIGGAKGVIRTLYGNPNNSLDIIPADLCVNGMLLSTYDYLTHKKRRIFNLSSHNLLKPLTWQENTDMGRDIVTHEVPPNVALWYPGGSVTSCRLYHYYRFLFYQLVPAIFVDILLYLLGRERFMLRVQKKVWKSYHMVEYFVKNQWVFKNDNMITARDALNSHDQKMFQYDTKDLDYRQYYISGIRGAKTYLLNEPNENLPAAKRLSKMLWFLDRLCKTLIAFGFLTFLWTFIVPLIVNNY